MSYVIRPNRRNSRPRTLRGQLRMISPMPVGVASVATGSGTLVVNFDGPVTLTGVPAFLKNGTIAPTGATLTGPQQVTLAYPIGASPTTLVVPFEDPAVRNPSGGFVNAGTYTVAAGESGEASAGFVGPGPDAVAA